MTIRDPQKTESFSSMSPSKVLQLSDSGAASPELIVVGIMLIA